MVRLSRRTFLAWAGAIAAFAAAVRSAASAPAARTPITLDDFLHLCRRLTGRAMLDAQVGKTYFDAIVAVPASAQVLGELVRGRPSANRSAPQLALEEAIIESWYTGQYEVNGEKRVATYGGALLWSVIGVPALGTCAGEFGAWSKPPRSQA